MKEKGRVEVEKDILTQTERKRLIKILTATQKEFYHQRAQIGQKKGEKEARKR